MDELCKAEVRKVLIWRLAATCRSLLGVALCLLQITMAIADVGKWELEQRRSFIVTLSYKQSATINNKLATSELAFICDQRNHLGVIGAVLVPFDGSFESHQDAVPLLIQKSDDEYSQSDLLQKWNNGSEFLFLDEPNEVTNLITVLKGKDVEAEKKSVHIRFPTTPENGQQTSNHIIVDASGFGDKFRQFEKDCTSFH